MRRAVGGGFLLLSLVCALLILRTVLEWRADALRWRAAAPVVMDTLAIGKALAERDRARAGERRAGARLDSLLQHWNDGRRRGEGRGAGRTGESPVPVAPPVDTGGCDELAEACAHFRTQALARAVADSTAAETRRQADSAAAHQVIARAQRAAADSIATARERTRQVERSLRRSRAETWLAVAAIAALLVHR